MTEVHSSGGSKFVHFLGRREEQVGKRVGKNEAIHTRDIFGDSHVKRVEARQDIGQT